MWNNIALNEPVEHTPSVSKSLNSTTEEVYQDVNDRIKLKGWRSKTDYLGLDTIDFIYFIRKWFVGSNDKKHVWGSLLD